MRNHDQLIDIVRHYKALICFYTVILNDLKDYADIENMTWAYEMFSIQY